VGALPNSHCSATLIAPTRVLTAAHCSALIGAPVQFGSLSASVTAVAVHPQYDITSQSDLNNIHDLAVLSLDTAIAVTPIPLNSTPPAAGWTIRIVGFGTTSVDGTGSDYGVKYTVPQAISAVGTAAFDYFVTSAYPGMSQNGDSGGPDLFVVKGVTVVGGVVNWGGATSGYDTRVDAHLAWIQQQL
jgi:hypothetical protein